MNATKLQHLLYHSQDVHCHTCSAFCCFTNLSIKTLTSPNWLKYLVVNENILDIVKWAAKLELLSASLRRNSFISLLKTTSNRAVRCYLSYVVALIFKQKRKYSFKELKFTHDTDGIYKAEWTYLKSRFKNKKNWEYFFNEVVHTDNYIGSLNKLFKCTAGIFIKRNFKF